MSDIRPVYVAEHRISDSTKLWLKIDEKGLFNLILITSFNKIISPARYPSGVLSDIRYTFVLRAKPDIRSITNMNTIPLHMNSVQYVQEVLYFFIQLVDM